MFLTNTAMDNSGHMPTTVNKMGIIVYRNDPKFSDVYSWANSADPDQTAPRGAV